MHEEPLRGGNTTEGVVRIGETVRRARDGRAAFAAKALVALNGSGFQWAPRYLGVDDEGRDVLSFVPGSTTDHPSQRDERCYRAVGELLRELHECTTGATHVRRFRDGCDRGLTPEVLLDAIERQQMSVINTESGIATDGRASEARRRHAEAAVAWGQADRRLLSANRRLFEAVLAD